jgi:hypothetical protein
MKKLIFALVISLSLFFVSSESAYAKKILPRAKVSKGVASKVVGSNPSVSVRFRSDRMAIIASFANLSKASSVTYMLSYNTRGTMQGAQGSVNVSENNTSREIIFGTCSHGVCRYDYGISNAKFIVTIKLPNGKKIVKTFSLRV